MVFDKSWQSRTALSVSLVMTSAIALPFVLAKSAIASSTNLGTTTPTALHRVPSTPTQIAQRFPDSWRSTLPAGTAIATEYDKDKIVVMPDETAPLTLKVAEDLSTGRGTVLIPAGSEIKGRLEPVGDGTQFVAEEVTIAGEREARPLDATSEIITRRETINRRSNPDVLKGAAIGGAAAAVLAEIFGRIDLWEVLGGAGIGALGSVIFRGRREVEVISVDPATDLTLTLQRDFTTTQAGAR